MFDVGSQDGVAFLVIFAPALFGGVYRGPATGGEATPFTRLESGQRSHRFPWFLPDGRHFLYFTTNAEMARKTSMRLTSDVATDQLPVWSPDEQQVVFASNRKGTFDLYIAPTDGSASETLLWELPGTTAPTEVANFVARRNDAALAR